MFFLGLAVGLVFVVLYDMAIDGWRSKSSAMLTGAIVSIERYEAARAANVEAAEDWKRRCIRALTEARDKCAVYAQLEKDASKLSDLIDEGRHL